MSDKPENPRAFPPPVSDNNMCYEGMGLREYFAAKAMQTDVTVEPRRHGTNAEMAYAQADAMLRARGV